MPQYMLILHEDPTAFRDVSADDMQQIVERYSAWAGSLAEQGRHLGGHKLTDDGGRWLRRGADGIAASDGPYTEGKEVIGGYFLVEAEDWSAAETLARECPHLAFGRIELRRVDSRDTDDR